MREYNPDRWVLCHIESKNDPHYRFLAGWYGGFTTGDSWKLSSGVLQDQVTMNAEGFFVSPQSSGSCYLVHPNAIGMSGYMSGIATSFLHEAEESNGALKFTVLSEDDTIALLKKWVDNHA